MQQSPHATAQGGYTDNINTIIYPLADKLATRSLSPVQFFTKQSDIISPLPDPTNKCWG